MSEDSERFFEAVKEGKLETVKNILTNTDVNVKNFLGQTALILAAREDYFDIVKYLVKGIICTMQSKTTSCIRVGMGARAQAARQARAFTDARTRVF